MTATVYRDEASYKRVLAISMLTMAILGEICLAGNFFSIAAIIEFVSQDLHITEWQAGFVQGIFGLFYAVGLLIWAPISKTQSSKVLYLIGLGGSGVCVILQFWAASFVEFVILRSLIGFFNGAVWVGSMKIVMQWFRPERHGTVIGIIIGAYSLAITLDFAVGLPFAMAYSWRGYLLGLGIFTLIIALASVVVLSDGPFSSDSSKYELKTGFLMHFLRSRWFWIGSIAIFGDLFAIGATTAWIIPSFIQTQSMDVALAPTIGMVLGISQITTIVIGGYLSDKMSKMKIILWGYVLTILSAILLVYSALTDMSTIGLLLVASFASIGAMSAGPIYSLLANRFSATLGPAAAGYAEMGGVVATFAAPFAMGLAISVVGVAQHTNGAFASAFVVFAIVEIAVYGVLMCLYRTVARKGP